MSPTEEHFTPPPDTNATGDAMQAYARVWRYVQYAVERYARSLTEDRDEREDLIQEARVELWRIDPSRCDLQNRNDVDYLRRMLRNCMRDLAKKRVVRAESVPASVVKELGGGSGAS